MGRTIEEQIRYKAAVIAYRCCTRCQNDMQL